MAFSLSTIVSIQLKAPQINSCLQINVTHATVNASHKTFKFPEVLVSFVTSVYFLLKHKATQGGSCSGVAGFVLIGIGIFGAGLAIGMFFPWAG